MYGPCKHLILTRFWPNRTVKDRIPNILSPSISGISCAFCWLKNELMPHKYNKSRKKNQQKDAFSTVPIVYISLFSGWKIADTLNNAITTEKKLINAVAKIRGLEKTAGLLYTWVWKTMHILKYL